ncbi:hypothetical protein BBB56_10510 [Candidatus Pantoea deserta]|uniref:Uncharacterized protein n=1 Tax=Candidatus Pantoea deserta TaxID=1869313 RepID=A0A3N4P9C5_9GAMM|nr:hypothetical protein [Pantoea deserta]RPE01291.1 hypothetical protein BBB56_10510 [Pantoea deserta]
MSIKDEEKLTNIVIGEAVMALLQQGTPVFAEQVAEKLRSMAASESDLNRKQACERALAEVLNGSDAQSSQQDGTASLH